MNRMSFTAVALGLTLAVGGCGSDNDDDSSGNSNQNVTQPPKPSPVGFYAGNITNAADIHDLLDQINAPDATSRPDFGPDKYYMLVLPTDVENEAQVWGGYVDTVPTGGEAWWGVIKGKTNATYNGTDLYVGAFDSLALGKPDGAGVRADSVLAGTDLSMVYDAAVPQITSGVAQLKIDPPRVGADLVLGTAMPQSRFFDQPADINTLVGTWPMRDHYLAAKQEALGGSDQGNLEVKVTNPTATSAEFEATYDLVGPRGRCVVTGTVTANDTKNYYTFKGMSGVSCSPDDGKTINGVIVLDDYGMMTVFGEADDASTPPNRAGIIMTTR